MNKNNPENKRFITLSCEMGAKWGTYHDKESFLQAFGKTIDSTHLAFQKLQNPHRKRFGKQSRPNPFLGRRLERLS